MRTFGAVVITILAFLVFFLTFLIVPLLVLIVFYLLLETRSRSKRRKGPERPPEDQEAPPSWRRAAGARELATSPSTGAASAVRPAGATPVAPPAAATDERTR